MHNVILNHKKDNSIITINLLNSFKLAVPDTSFPSLLFPLLPPPQSYSTSLPLSVMHTLLSPLVRFSTTLSIHLSLPPPLCLPLSFFTCPFPTCLSSCPSFLCHCLPPCPAPWPLGKAYPRLYRVILSPGCCESEYHDLHLLGPELPSCSPNFPPLSLNLN